MNLSFRMKFVFIIQTFVSSFKGQKNKGVHDFSVIFYLLSKFYDIFFVWLFFFKVPRQQNLVKDKSMKKERQCVMKEVELSHAKVSIHD